MSKQFELNQRLLREAKAKTQEQLNAEYAASQAKVAPVAKRAVTQGYGNCHYCGMPATGFNFFDVPVCDECR